MPRSTCTLHSNLDTEAQWTYSESLEHFLQCISDEEQIRRWVAMQNSADALVRIERKAAWDRDAAPYEDFGRPDLSVTVKWPAEAGMMQGVTYGRNTAPDPETLTALDRRIIRVLLEHALSQVGPAYPYPVVPPPVAGF